MTRTPELHAELAGADTRRRVYDAARDLFTDLGFDNVTVRDICKRAEANLAAVNYHFGDKLALYLEVVRDAIEKMKAANEELMPGGDVPAEERLRRYIRSYLPRLMLVEERHGWIQKLMRNEMADPTPGARLIIEQAILPRLTYLARVVAELLDRPVEDPAVRRTVASIQSQCLFYLPDPVKERVMPGWPERTRTSAAEAAEHVVVFSLAGIAEVKRRG